MSGTSAGAILGECDHHLAPLGLLRGLGTRAGVEKRKLDHSLRRLAHDFESDVAAHRQSRERKPGRRCGQNAPRNRRHAVVASMVGNRDWPEPPQCGDLVRVKSRRAGQSRNEHNRQRVWHWGLSGAERGRLPAGQKK